MEAISVPDTPAGRRASEWLECFGCGEFDPLREFAAQRSRPSALAERSAERQATWQSALHRTTGGLVPTQVEHSTETDLALLVRARLTGEWLRVSLAVDGDSPHLIEGFAVWFLAPWEPPFGPALSEPELVQEFGAFVERLAEGGCFSGAVLLAHGDERRLECAHGMARREDGIPNRPDTRFNLASLNKMFTGVAVAQLAQDGRLGFGETIGQHLPDYPEAVAQKITVHQLLTHTSGLNGFFSDELKASHATVKEVSDYLPLFADEPLLFEPGTRVAYSNAGYGVLGALIETVSGQRYHDYVREHIFTPAGMADTDSYELTSDDPTLAIGYTRGNPDAGSGPENGLQSNIGNWALPPRGGPFGCGFSTIGDLHRFGQALLGHHLLSPKLTGLVLSPKVQMDPQRSYGYGFEERRVAGLRSIGHGGGAPGANARLSLYPELGDTLVVLSNFDPPIADRIADHERRLRCAQRAAGSV